MSGLLNSFMRYASSLQTGCWFSRELKLVSYRAHIGAVVKQPSNEISACKESSNSSSLPVSPVCDKGVCTTCCQGGRDGQVKGSHWALSTALVRAGNCSHSCCLSAEGSWNEWANTFSGTACHSLPWVFLCSTEGGICTSPSLRESDLAVVFAEYNPLLFICYLQILLLVTNLHGQWLY